MDSQRGQPTNPAHAGNIQEDHVPAGHTVVHIKNEPISDGIEIENNPWNVESLQAFLCLKCPQCIFDTKEKDSFQNHAIENHPLSIVLFGRVVKEEKHFDLEDNFLADKIDSQDPLQCEPDYLDYCESKLEEFDYEYTEYNDQRNKENEEKKTYQSHQCTICKREFVGKNAKRNMNDHVAVVHEGKKPFQCEICKSCFSRERNLRAHISFVHEGNTPFQCTECNEGFGYKHLFDRHIKLKHDKIPYTPYQCTICKKEFSGVNGKRNMNQHVAVVHEGKKPFQCEICNSCFSKKVGLEKHISSVHDGNKPFKCNLCQYATVHKGDLTRHVESVHEGKKPYQCTICKKDFAGLRHMKEHVAVVHEGKKPFQCETCNSCFSRKDKLRTHISSVHEGIKPFKCYICQYATVRKGDLDKHIKEVHSPENNFECENCGKKCKSKEAYNTHRKYYEGKCQPPNLTEKIMLQNPEPGICPHCGEYFERVQQHILYMHTTEKPYKCPKCEFAHTLKKGLDSHMKTVHPVESALKICHICSYKTSTNQTLRNHIESVHEQIKNFSCPHDGCDLKFYRERTMKKHFMLKHSSERPHKCEICGEAFAIKEKLQTHKRKVHEGKKYSCETCGKEHNNAKSLKRHNVNLHGMDKKRKLKFDSSDH